LGDQPKGFREIYCEQAYLSAEQPSSCKDPRFPCTHAYPRRPRNLGCSSQQGSHRTKRLEAQLLPRDNRLTSGDDIRDVVRNGKRFSNQLLTLHFLKSEETKFAIIVSKALGNAVQRNLVKRRSRAALQILIDSYSPQTRAVLRMRPEASSAKWPELLSAITELVKKVDK